MQFVTTLQKEFVLDANVTVMNINKILFEFRRNNEELKIKEKKLFVDDKKVIDHTHILECIREFYETYFRKRKQKTESATKSFISHLNIPKLSEDKSKLYWENLTEKDLCDSLKSMQNNKSPGNNGFTKKFYQTFWKEIKAVFVDSVLETKEK